MSRLDREPDVIQLASELGVVWQRDPVNNVIAYCLKKIRRWVEEGGPTATITDLERLVREKLHLVFEEVGTDEDLDRIIRKYIALGENVFATLKTEFDDATFAVLLERRTVTSDAIHRYVAIIDCRGEKASRRFFTRWHEIAHLLTLVRQLEFPFHRSRDDNTPLERLMDTVAGEVGFYDPIFTPALKEELRTAKRLSFQSVEAIRSRFCSEASFQSTLLAAVRRAPIPILYVEVGLGYKKHEEASLRSRQMDLFPSAPPTAKLRVLNVTPNEAARTVGLRIDRNMQVPPASIIGNYFGSAEAATSLPTEGVEGLGIWLHSDGTSLGTGLVHIEVRPVRNHAIALVQPVSGRKR